MSVLRQPALATVSRPVKDFPTGPLPEDPDDPKSALEQHRSMGLKAAAEGETISCTVPRVPMATGTKMEVENISVKYELVNRRGKATKERAKWLISIAHPGFRDELTHPGNR